MDLQLNLRFNLWSGYRSAFFFIDTEDDRRMTNSDKIAIVTRFALNLSELFIFIVFYFKVRDSANVLLHMAYFNNLQANAILLDTWIEPSLLRTIANRLSSQSNDHHTASELVYRR